MAQRGTKICVRAKDATRGSAPSLRAVGESHGYRPPMPRELHVSLTGRFAQLLPLTIDDVPGLLTAANEDRSTYGYTLVPETMSEMEDVVRHSSWSRTTARAFR
jgi:hypothetical protein